MTLPNPSVRALRLPQLEAAQAWERNVLAQRLQGVCVPWGSQSWRLSLTPSVEPGPLIVGEAEWCVQLSWDSVALDLLLPAATVHSWLRAQSKDLDVSEVPEALAAIVLEDACHAMRDSLACLGHGGARIDRMIRGPAEGRPLEHAFLVQATCREVVVFGRLALGPLGLARLARLASDLPLADNGIPVDRLQPTWRVEIGATWLTIQETERLSVGDFVLIEHSYIHTGRHLWLAAGEYGLRVAMGTTQLVVERPFGPGGWAMQTDKDETATPSSLESIDQLPLRLVFDLGEVSMPLGEVRCLQVGQTIELGYPLARAVRVRINGDQVATGELVEIDGHLGVTLTAVRRHPLSSAPRMTVRRGRKPASDAQAEAEPL